ncbi:nucleoside 2-deoxyribosyltransferase [Pseudomonas sp. LF19]|uniref:nucleoside 2-deoxyribosyltransferase n=1 Tax=Pseudomonas sp. LF19 TaxID=2899115 RepID=UPI001F1AEBD4|nr:nucleoside 2-deoxyribosyltransferase [Pseudomonas sp. LF19]MCE5981977.1 nucleoside 2-deoxyribosyltransferase [Pseudomonas sp. LF19]
MPLPLRKVYLAGGFRSNWQAIVKSKLKDFELLDPSAHGIEDPAEYTNWDLAAVRDSDIVLANMEASNPGGYALALEVGFAKALGKSIYLVDQIEDLSIRRYFEMVRQCSTRVFSTLDEAIVYIATVERS